MGSISRLAHLCWTGLKENFFLHVQNGVVVLQQPVSTVMTSDVLKLKKLEEMYFERQNEGTAKSGQELKRRGASLFQSVIRQSLNKSLIHKPCNEGQIVGSANGNALLQGV